MVRIAGRLSSFIVEWQKITSDPNILEIISNYKLPFVAIPPPRPSLIEPKLSSEEIVACKNEIKRLISRGAIEPVESSPDQFLSSYFLIDKSSGGKRFILNLKALNKFFDPPHFKMEDIKMAQRLMRRDCYMASIDLEDAYLLVPIDPEYRKFLCFSFQGQVYQFNALPFGLSSAPYVFTKILKPVAAYLRERGLKSVIYLDDFLLLGESYNKCKENVQITINFLRSLGFILSLRKCELEPAKQRKYLGYILDSRDMSISLPAEKRELISQWAASFLTKTSCKIRDFASLLGLLNFASNVTVYGPMYTRELERDKYLALLKNGENYNKKMTVSNCAKENLNWWIKTLAAPGPAKSVLKEKFSIEIFSDASLRGWGATANSERTHGWWSAEQAREHINYLELKAVQYALRCFAGDLRSKYILLRIDNTTAMSYINRMGSVQFPHLSALAKSIWQWCERRELVLFASYIPSAENCIADAESRYISLETEWELNPSVFQDILTDFGSFDIDLFATNVNAKCNKFVSWFPDPYAYAIDAFTLDWSKFYFYAFPPFAIIARVLQKIIIDRAEGVLVVPWWPAQPWFPLFNELRVSEILRVEPHANLLCSPFRDSHPIWQNISLAAARLSGRPIGEKDPRTPL